MEIKFNEAHPLTPTMALIKKWLDEDATENLAELEIAEDELNEFKRNMNFPR